MPRLPILLCACLLTRPVLAAEEEPAASQAEPLPVVSGTVAAGALSSSGNTESRSVNVDAAVEVAYEIWRHKGRISGYQASEEGEDTAERYKGSLQSDYRFSERNYLFGNAGYETDKFGAFDRQASVSAGLGRRFVDSGSVTLDLEGGLGRRVSEPDGTNDREREGIARFNGELNWNFSEHGRFTQSLEVVSGSSNTATESVSSVRSRLVADLSWRLSHTVAHNSDVPAGTENTDTFTSVSLEYAF